MLVIANLDAVVLQLAVAHFDETALVFKKTIRYLELAQVVSKATLVAVLALFFLVDAVAHSSFGKRRF
jgi:hypothetical protein